MARPRHSLYIIKKLVATCINSETAIFGYITKMPCARHCYMHQQQDRDTATIGTYYKKALCWPLLHASTARLRLLVYILKEPVLAVARCINGNTAIFGIYYEEALCFPLLHALTTKSMIFGSYYKEALCSPLLHGSTARPQFSVYIIKKLCARCCWICQRRDRCF